MFSAVDAKIDESGIGSALVKKRHMQTPAQNDTNATCLSWEKLAVLTQRLSLHKKRTEVLNNSYALLAASQRPRWHSHGIRFELSWLMQNPRSLQRFGNHRR